MLNSRLAFLIATIGILSMLVSGCTYQVWQSAIKFEEVTGMYVDQEQHRLFALGERHGYVFSIDDKFQRTLILSRSINFTPILREFALSKDNRIAGTVELFVYRKQLKDCQKDELVALGFKPDVGDDILRYKIRIEGTMYETVGKSPYERFQKNIHVAISLPSGGVDTARRLCLTPGAVVTDAMVSAPASILVVLFMATDR